MVKFTQATIRNGLFVILVVIIAVIAIHFALPATNSTEPFELPFLVENDATQEIYGNSLSQLPTRNCKSNKLLTASQFFSRQYKGGIPLPFSGPSEFERKTNLVGFNIADFAPAIPGRPVEPSTTIASGGIMVPPAQALDTKVIDPTQLQVLTVTEAVAPGSTVPPPEVTPTQVAQINAIRGPDVVFESIPGPESERTIPATQLKPQQPSIAQRAAQRISIESQRGVTTANRLQVQRLVSLGVQAGEANVSIQNALSSVQSQNFDDAAGSVSRAARLTSDIFNKLAGIRAELGIRNGSENRLGTAFNQVMQVSQDAIETTASAENAVTSLTSDNTVTDIATTIALAENILADANISTQSLQNSINSVISAQISKFPVAPTNPTVPGVQPLPGVSPNNLAIQMASNANGNAITNGISIEVANQLAAASNNQIANQIVNSITNGNTNSVGIMNANKLNAPNTPNTVSLPPGVTFGNASPPPMNNAPVESVPLPPGGLVPRF